MEGHDRPPAALAAMSEPQPAIRLLRPDRSYKLVRVRDEDGSIVLVTD